MPDAQARSEQMKVPDDDVRSSAGEAGAVAARGRVWLALLGGLLTAGMWQLCFPPVQAWPVAYVVLAPWLATAVLPKRGRTAGLIGYLTVAALFAAGLYWLTWITPLGYVALVFYLGWYGPLTVWVVRRAHRLGWPMWLILPVLWVALEYARAWVLSGFPWFFLSHSQVSLIPLIQIADLTGAYGVTFFVAMVNGLLLDVLRHGRSVRIAWGAGAVALVLGGLLAYGFHRTHESSGTTAIGPVVGVAQCAYPVSLQNVRQTQAADVRGATPAQWVETLVTQSVRLPLGELDLLVWPETVLPILPADVDRMSTDPRRYAPGMQEQAQALNQISTVLAIHRVPLLAGAMTVRRADASGVGGREELQVGNSALLLQASKPDRLDMLGRYDKMHCVPFSEYVPFGDSWPWLHRLLRQAVPSEMLQLTPGRRVVRFTVPAPAGQAVTAVPICYEGVFARVCRKLAYDRDGSKKVDFLTNISNDGWFISPWGSGRWPSSELEQHLTAYNFRAVECRVPIVRCVNTGISGFIDSNGRVEKLLTDDEGRTKMVEGVAWHPLLLDNRQSAYGRIGDVFAQACSVASLAIATGMIVLGRRSRRARKDV